MPNTYEVPLTFVVCVEAEDPYTAIDEAFKLYDSGDLTERIMIGSIEPLEINHKEVEKVED